VIFAFDMVFMLKRLNKHYHNTELTINMSKTEYMAVNSSASFQISISNEQVNMSQVSGRMGY